MSYDYRVTVRAGGTAAGWRRIETFEQVATRPSVAVARALDAYQRAHRGESVTRLTVELERLGVHKRGPCGGSCTAYVDAAAAEAAPWGEAPRCGAPCALLENHMPNHRCAAHGRELARTGA